MNQRIIVQLGRLGDILNVLPLLYDDNNKGSRSGLMVAKEFSELLDGVSYCDRYVFDGHMSQLDLAVKQAETLSGDVKVCQLVGPLETIKKAIIMRNGVEYRATTESFQKDQWNLAGRLEDWKRQIPLVFDRRDPEREAKLIKQVFPNKRKTILVATGGTSSPFPYSELLYELLRLKFRTYYSIVNISDIKAERFYDLLGVFEHPQALCLVSTDSAPLHLAYAAKNLPVVALVNDRPSLWHGSVWRPNHIAHLRYHDFAERACEILTAINTIREPGSPFFSELKERRIIHVWSGYEKEATDSAWGPVYEDGHWIKCPVEKGALGNDSKFTRHPDFKDDLRYPFLKDVIRLAMLRAQEDDVICLTRADTQPLPNITERLLEGAPCFSTRAVLAVPGNMDSPGKLEHHPAGELFAFTKKWWREHQSKVPDFILGKDHYFLRAFLEFMRQNGAKELPFTTYTQPKTIVPQGSKEVPKRVAYNEGLTAKYMKSVNYPPMYPKVSEQLKMEPLNRIALKPFGYNPSIARIGGRTFMAYRWHEEDTPATSIVMAQIDDHWNPLETVEIRVPKGGGIQSIDDPRLFVYEGELHISYVASTWPDKTPKSTVHYARLARDGQFWTLIDSTRIDYGKNDGTAMEKNWIFFERDQKLFCIYHNDPQQVVLQVVGDQVITEHKSPTPHWPWGRIHGGTVPVPYKDKLLRFFHTRLDNEPAPTRWRYYMGACLMNPEPPFEIVQVCREPIARGSEADDLTDLQRSSCIHHKKSVVFPGGCVQDGNDFLVSIGINDCECAVARIAESDLKL